MARSQGRRTGAAGIDKPRPAAERSGSTGAKSASRHPFCPSGSPIHAGHGPESLAAGAKSATDGAFRSWAGEKSASADPSCAGRDAPGASIGAKSATRGAPGLKLESKSAAADAFRGNGAAGSDCDDTFGDSDGAFCITGGESWGGLAARTRTPTLESDPDHDPDARCASACASPGAPSASTGACRSIAGIRYPTTAIIRDGQGALGHHGGNLKPRSVRRRVAPWISDACALAGTRYRGGTPDRPAAHRRIHPRCAEAHRPAPCGAAIPDGPRARREQFRCLQS